MSNRDVGDIARGALASLGGFGGRMVARLALMVSAGHLYGVSNVGFLGQLAAIVEILAAIAVFGLKRSLLDMLGFAAKHDQPLGRAIATALTLSMGIAAGLGLILYLVWPILFPAHGDMPVLVFFALPAIAFADVSSAATRYRRVIRWEVLARCVVEPWTFLGIALGCYFFGLQEEGLPIAYAASLIAAAFTGLWGLFHTYSSKDVVTWRPDLKALPKMAHQSLPVGITDIGVMMLRRVDILLLGLFVDHRITGLYYMAQQITTVPHKIYQLFEPMMAPVIASLHHAQNADGIRSKLVGLCRWVFTLQIGLTVPLMVFGDRVLGLFGHQFAAGAVVLGVLLMAELVDGSFSLVETPLVFARRTVPAALIMAALLVEAVSIPAFSYMWGAEGAALGFLCTTVLLAVGRLYMLERTLDIGVVDRGYVGPLLIAVLVGGALWSLRPYIPVESPSMAGFTILSGIGCFLLLINTFIVSDDDRRIIRGLRSR
ncbi:lipopolysaccharide biosynthesis protein [Kordiimonas marina]|uniref:lipopolysaccharide biosynthesis protein n=1 Tax=Kordiimonas marina TaxID=2872312 RepID=UPI001FF411D4|nr:oligosaccharide flippase family protein [Kordiimonas marina]MCJ9429625.1 polysaccharide biosynthesis C-terminal domain-containing protein [Kordiimonas marina]